MHHIMEKKQLRSWASRGLSSPQKTGEIAIPAYVCADIVHVYTCTYELRKIEKMLGFFLLLRYALSFIADKTDWVKDACVEM